MTLSGPRRDGVRLVARAALLGLGAGLVLAALTGILDVHGPEGTWTLRGGHTAWSFRGNGALVVPLGLGPAVLLGAWVALILHRRGHDHWLRAGLAASGLDALLVIAGEEPFLGGVSPLMSALPLLLVVVGPLIAAAVPVAAPVARRASRRWYAAAALAIPVVAVAGGALLGQALLNLVTRH